MDQLIYSATRIYKTGNHSPVFLNVTVGDGQVGGSSIIFDDREIATGNINNYPIGKPGDDIRYKILRCNTTVKDINPDTNKTIVTCSFIGGASDEDFIFDTEVKENGGEVLYSLTFTFI
jgi:hypothetical protein